MIPVMEFYASSLRVEVDGMLLREQSLHRDFRSYRNYYNRKQALVDSRISRTEFDAAFTGTGGGNALNLEMNQFEGSLAQLYQNWLGYSQFNLLVFYASSINDMPEGVRRAMFDYVRAGGSLLTIGAISLPEDFVERAPASQDLPLHLKVFHGGYGKVISGSASLIKDMSDGSGNSLPDYLCDMFSAYEFRGDSPLRFKYDETETLSTRWLMVIVYIFAFLIGPVNVFVLHRLGRKILVFLTVPVASAICCLFIYGYYLVFESATLRVKRQALTLLDERFNRAVTLANYAVFSSSSRPEGLRFDNQTEVFTYTGSDGRMVDGGKFISLDEDQHLTTGWIKPKVPRYLHLRALQTRRERVSLTWQSEDLQLLNGLGADIESITLMTQDRRLFIGKNIAAGAQAFMKASGSATHTVYRAPSDLFSSLWFKELRTLQSSPEQHLQPGTYVARIKSSPFLIQDVDSQAERVEESYVIGILKGDAQP
ncbi:MAG: hypothetical protein ACD_39C00348G0001 [uncultured bacterium]|nr:MAG: hypothetical protein ACD_39C00348G0001 [uncultured bacterium]